MRHLKPHHRLQEDSHSSDERPAAVGASLLAMLRLSRTLRVLASSHIGNVFNKKGAHGPRKMNMLRMF